MKSFCYYVVTLLLLPANGDALAWNEWFTPAKEFQTSRHTNERAVTSSARTKNRTIVNSHLQVLPHFHRKLRMVNKGSTRESFRYALICLSKIAIWSISRWAMMTHASDIGLSIYNATFRMFFRPTPNARTNPLCI